MNDLVERLSGIYRIPITDGLGPAGGEEPDNPSEFVRRFEVPPIHREAAAEIKRLRAALAPFAKAADVKLCGEWRDDQHFGQTDVTFHLTFGDLRRARAALSPAVAESEESRNG